MALSRTAFAAAAAPLLLATLLGAQETPRLGGGFGRVPETPTPVPTATPVPTPAAAPPPAAVPEATAAPAPRPRPTARPVPVVAPASPSAPLVTPLSPSASPAEPQRAVASVSVGYVLIPFVVTDLKGRTRRDVRREDVTLFVDGKPVAFDLFEQSEGAPVSFTILLDGSGSMALLGKMDGARTALGALLSANLPGDDYALYVFSEGQLREAVPFTRDQVRVRRAVRDLVPFGKTALFDALARMPELSLQGKNGVRAILLLTDGIDNASRLTLEQLDELFSGVDVPVYPVGIGALGAPVDPVPGPADEKVLNLRVLGDLARMSGGRLAVVPDPDRLPEAIGDIERDLRTQYAVGFTPSGRGEVKFRRISLRIAGSAYRLRVRAGYRGSEPPEPIAR